jgi:hypothetical protein
MMPGMGDGLSKQVEDPAQNAELIAMKKKIGFLQGLYFALFIASLVLIVYNYQTHAASSMHILWAFALGGAVVVRLIRQSLVNKYNQILMGGRQGPLT